MEAFKLAGLVPDITDKVPLAQAKVTKFEVYLNQNVLLVGLFCHNGILPIFATFINLSMY